MMANTAPTAREPVRGEDREGRVGPAVRVDPELQKWLNDNEIRSRRFGGDLPGTDESVRTFVDIVVRITGDYIWRNAKPCPDWSGLDVRGLQREIILDRLRLDDVAAGNFTVTLMAFYLWLARSRELSASRALAIIGTLEAYLDCYAPVPRSPSWRYLRHLGAFRS